MVEIIEDIILRKMAFKKIKKIAKRKLDKEDKEAIGFLIGYFHENSLEIKDIIIPDQTASKISVKVEEEVSLVNALIKSNKKGMNEICVGWFHSHPPGYGCFLSATDIETQMYWQRVNPRNIALVYDPVHSEIKAFRTKKEKDSFKEINIPVRLQD
jgi:26S proteasome regulatory subunit N11